MATLLIVAEAQYTLREDYHSQQAPANEGVVELSVLQTGLIELAGECLFYTVDPLTTWHTWLAGFGETG